MQHFKIFIVILFSSSMLLSCTGNKTSKPPVANSSSQQIIDTNKLKSDLNDIESSLLSGKPDTNKLKKAGADIISTDAAILSDSGISKMYGNSNDPSVNAAKKILIKMRNGVGLTPDKLDSIKKAASKLEEGTTQGH